MTFDLAGLRLFCFVAETGSITRGADKAHLSASAASERLSRLEATVGVQLFDRLPKGIQLTSAGRTMLQHSKLVLHQLELMRGEMHGYAKGLRGRIRMMSNTVGVAELLPDQLSAFLSQHPDIDIDLEERTSKEIIEAVAAGFIDIGVVPDWISHEGLQSFPLTSERLVLVLPEASPFSSRTEIAFQEITSFTFVGLSHSPALEQRIAGYAAQFGETLKFRIKLSSFDAVARGVEAGVGAAIMPYTAFRRIAIGKDIRAVSFSDSWTAFMLIVCVNSHTTLPAHAKSLLDHLRSTHAPQLTV